MITTRNRNTRPLSTAIAASSLSMAIALLSGCANNEEFRPAPYSQPGVYAPSPTSAPLAQAPTATAVQPAAHGARRASPRDTFGTGDLVTLYVYEGVRNSKKIIGGDYAVDPDGNIRLGHLGPVAVVGLTPAEVSRKISSVCTRSDRGLGVNFTTHFAKLGGAPVVVLQNGVNMPGILTLGSEKMTLSQAVAYAGGLSNPNQSAIYIVREGRKRLVLVGSQNFRRTKLEAGDIILTE